MEGKRRKIGNWNSAVEKESQPAQGPGGRVTLGSLSLSQVAMTAWPELDSGMDAIDQFSIDLLTSLALLRGKGELLKG